MMSAVLEAGPASVAGTSTGLLIEGRVDLVNAERICEEGLALVRARLSAPADGSVPAAGQAAVEVDLAQLDHAGSVVVAVLLVWARACSQPLRLLALPDSLRRVLEFTGMDDLFDLTGTATAACPQ